MNEPWNDAAALRLELDGDAYQTSHFAVVFIPADPFKPPAPPRIIQQRGPRPYFGEAGQRVSIDPGDGKRLRAVVLDQARYEPGTIDELIVLVVREHSGP